MTDHQNARLGVYGGHSDGTENLGLDRFERTQEPKLTPTSDPLARFVIARIIEAETEPRGEVIAAYDLPAEAMAHRYAKGVRRDMVVFRRIVAEYLAEVERVRANREEAGASARGYGIRVAVRALAERWSDHPEFDKRWELP